MILMRIVAVILFKTSTINMINRIFNRDDEDDFLFVDRDYYYYYIYLYVFRI